MKTALLVTLLVADVIALARFYAHKQRPRVLGPWSWGCCQCAFCRFSRGDWRR